jgi:hypothetical protein
LDLNPRKLRVEAVSTAVASRSVPCTVIGLMMLGRKIRGDDANLIKNAKIC